jgi:hypothetical protein
MSAPGYVAWATGGWRGLVRADLPLAPHEVLEVVAAGGGRRSRHARTRRVELAGGVVYVKAYPAPDARRAFRAFRMGHALALAGFGAPEALLVGRRGRGGVLVTRDVGAPSLLDALAAVSAGSAALAGKRRLLCALGEQVGRLHRAGFVHGDLVPSNLLAQGEHLVLLDHDRTRRGPALVWWGGRRNLVQLGRFVVPGVTLSDRARVLGAYAEARGWSTRTRRRLARWLVRATTARRCRIDRVEPAAARGAGFRELMRSGGRFDPAREGRS